LFVQTVTVNIMSKRRRIGDEHVTHMPAPVPLNASSNDTLLHMTDFLPNNDFVNLLNSAKRMHCLPHNRVETSWKRRYKQTFEEQSELHEFVAPAGDKTPWSVRFARRQQVERNQERGLALLESVYNVLLSLPQNITDNDADNVAAENGIELHRDWHSCTRLDWFGNLLTYEFAAAANVLVSVPAIARITVE